MNKRNIESWKKALEWWIVSSTSNGKAMILSKCAIRGCKKSRFIKNQEAKGLLSNLGIKTPLSKVPILVDILF